MQVRKQSSSTPQIGLTPLIDVVFILLIFFMVATSFDMPRLLSLKPATGGKGGNAERAIVKVDVGSNGACFLDGTFQTCDEVGSIIRQQGRGRDLPVITLTPKTGAKLQDVITVMDALALSGLSDTVLMPNSNQVPDQNPDQSPDLSGMEE
ncbi:ExbD/TolR family protein [Kiloniella majae]|uniref:ExbD/TolR family protein n=1 Tax=Kiloniella majae TaxID=1938558 RepID=UPI000A27764D|nr:biopolymer transporter ExbD [Kiloniella majae]